MAYSAWSVVFGEQPSASKWNILGTNDAFFNTSITTINTELATVTAWTQYVPTITAPGGTAPTYTATSTGKYRQIGNFCFMTFTLTNSSGGTAGAGAVQLFYSLPKTAVQTESTANVVPGGSSVVYNAGATGYNLPYVASTTTGSIRGTDTSNITAANQNGTVRQMYVFLMYETA